MTGLDLENDVIIEISCIITNGNLEVMDEEGWGAVIHQNKETMDKMVGGISSSVSLAYHSIPSRRGPVLTRGI